MKYNPSERGNLYIIFNVKFPPNYFTTPTQLEVFGSCLFIFPLNLSVLFVCYLY